MTAHTLEAVQALESVGFERKQAEAITKIVAAHDDATYATKADNARLEGKIKAESSQLEGKIKADNAQLEGRIEAAIAALRADLRADIARLESKIDADIARLEGKMDGRMNSFESSMRTLTGMMIGIYAGAFVAVLVLTLNHLIN